MTVNLTLGDENDYDNHYPFGTKNLVLHAGKGNDTIDGGLGVSRGAWTRSTSR
jgi:hypothetical protein